MNPIDLASYDRIVVAFSGGKDSLACFLNLLDENGLIPLWSMRSANLRAANLREADLTSADLTSANLRAAYYSKYTVLPEDFDAKSAGMLWIEL